MSFVGWFRKTTTSTWSASDIFQVNLETFNVTGTEKKIKFDLIAFPFGTQREFQMSIYQNGNASPIATKTLSFNPLNQTYTNDMSVTLPLSPTLSENNFEIHIKSKRLGRN
jgi:hypothetical protein